MLSTEKITGAFAAICEEAEKLKQEEASQRVREGLSLIISIARHQNDLRGAAKGSCSAHAKA
jgi:hypothetical protein